MNSGYFFDGANGAGFKVKLWMIIERVLNWVVAINKSRGQFGNSIHNILLVEELVFCAFDWRVAGVWRSRPQEILVIIFGDLEIVLELIFIQLCRFLLPLLSMRLAPLSHNNHNYQYSKHSQAHCKCHKNGNQLVTANITEWTHKCQWVYMLKKMNYQCLILFNKTCSIDYSSFYSLLPS
jgi:hypothetical protein